MFACCVTPVSAPERSTYNFASGTAKKCMGKHSRFVSTHSCKWKQATTMLPKFSQMHRFYKFQSGACDRFWRKSTSGTFRTWALPQKLLAPMNRVGQTSRASWSLGLRKLIIADHGRSNSVSHTCSEMNARQMFLCLESSSERLERNCAKEGPIGHKESVKPVDMILQI